MSEDGPKRANYRAAATSSKNRPFGQAAYDQATQWIDRYGLAIGDKMIQAQDWLEIDLKHLRQPPTGWSFVPLVVAAIDAPPGAERTEYNEEQSRDARAFWSWYGPLESYWIGLCRLIVQMSRIRDTSREVADQFEALLCVAHGLYEHYRRWDERGVIAWLPKRLEWRSRGRPEMLTVLEFLGRHLIEYSGEPPRTEEPPPHTDADRMWEKPF